MNQCKAIILAITGLISFSSIQAYKTRVENRTSGNITVSINLAACRALQTGVIQPNQTSAVLETGACCFESVNAIGTSTPITNLSSGDVKPWGQTSWQCFRNLKFIVTEKHENGKITGLKIDQVVE